MGISSPVVADINLDGRLEVVIGDSKGNLHVIDAGGRSVRGQMDWPMFHYDLNKTGYYNPQTSFGVDLYPQKTITPVGVEIESLIKTVEPGKTVTFNITVKNTGRAFGSQATDVIYLGFEGVPDGWNARLKVPPDMGNPNPDYVRLNVDETENITLLVTAPWEGDIGDLARINVTGNSSRDPWAKDTLQTITMINIDIDFDAGYTHEEEIDPTSPYYELKWDRISPGAEGVYAVVVANTGNCNDTYRVKISGVPDGWTAYFIDSGTDTTFVTLMSPIFEEIYNDPVSATLLIKVGCPPDATLDEEAWVKITVTSMKSNDTGEGGIDIVFKYDELVLVADELTDIRLTCDEPSRFVTPGGSVDFEVVVENLSNDEIEVLYSLDGVLDEWKVEIIEESQLLIGQKIKVLLTLWAPEGAPADLTCVMTLTGKIKGQTNLASTVGLTAIVRHVYALRVDVNPQKLSVDPGDEVNVDISVKNLGNGKDILFPRPYDVNMGWNMSFIQEGFNVNAVNLFYKGYANFSLRMKVPGDTVAKQYRVGVNISGIRDHRYQIHNGHGEPDL